MEKTNFLFHIMFNDILSYHVTSDGQTNIRVSNMKQSALNICASYIKGIFRFNDSVFGTELEAF